MNSSTKNSISLYKMRDITLVFHFKAGTRAIIKNMRVTRCKELPRQPIFIRGNMDLKPDPLIHFSRFLNADSGNR